PMLPGWVFVAACLAYGLVASWQGWPVMAGCAAGCLAAPHLRAAVADNGAGPAALGYVLATLAMAALVLHTTDADDDGTLPARETATLLWLSGMVAAGLGVVLADAAGWVLC